MASVPKPGKINVEAKFASQVPNEAGKIHEDGNAGMAAVRDDGSMSGVDDGGKADRQGRTVSGRAQRASAEDV